MHVLGVLVLVQSGHQIWKRDSRITERRIKKRGDNIFMICNLSVYFDLFGVSLKLSSKLN